VDVSNLHEAHLDHLEEKMDTINKLLADLLESNILLERYFNKKLKRKT